MPAKNSMIAHHTGSLESGFLELDSGKCPNDAIAQKPDYQELAREVAVAFCYNGISHAVMMASPWDLEDFAYGFSVTSGVLSRGDQIIDLEAEVATDSAILQITLNQRALHQLRRSHRAMAGTSGCGLCGFDALSQTLAPPDQEISSPFAGLMPVEHLADLRQRFLRAQQYRASCGAMHAALYVDAYGATRFCREDIGRHNALDKLIGACVRDGVDLSAGFVAVTSRCSLELIQKSLRVGVGTLVSLASPTDIAVRWAREYGLNLLHQPARGPTRLYSSSAIENLASNFPVE